MKKIYLVLVCLVCLVALTVCKQTNKARGTTNKLTGTWTVEVDKWQNPGTNNLTLARKAASSNDVSSDSMPATPGATPVAPGQTPQGTTPPPKPEQKAAAEKPEDTKVKISLDLKADTKKKEVSGTLTRTQGGTSQNDTITGKLKGTAECEGDYKTNENKTGKFTCKLNSQDSLSVTITL